MGALGPSRPRVTAVAVAVVIIGLVLAALSVPAAAEPVRSGPAPSTLRAAAAHDFPDVSAACGNGPTTICRLTRFPRRPWLVLMGDSHAFQYLAPVRAMATRRRVNLVLTFAGGCPLSVPFPASSGEPRMTCDKHNAKALDHVRRLAASGRRVRVILGSWWHIYRKVHRQVRAARAAGDDDAFSIYQVHQSRLGVLRSRAFFRAIGRAGIPADVLAQAGTVPPDARACAAGQSPYQCDLPRRRVLPREADNRRWLAGLSKQLANRPIVIDPAPTYCGATTCRARVGVANTFYDEAHLGMRLTRSMRRYFRPTFRALLRQR